MNSTTSLLNKQIESTNWFKRVRLSIVGVNWSILTLGLLTTFTKGGETLRQTFFKNGFIDLIIFTFVFLCIFLFCIILFFRKSQEQWTQKKRDDLAMLETILGLCGIMLFGVLGASPLYIVIPVIASFLLRGRGVLPMLTVSFAGAISCFLIHFNDVERFSSLTTTIIGVLALICVILGTVGVEAIIMKSTFSMYIHYFVILLLIMLSFKFEPVFLVTFPILAFIIINFGIPLKNWLLKKIKSNYITNEVYKFIFTKRLQRISIFILNVTKVLILVSIIGFFVLSYLASKIEKQSLLLKVFLVDSKTAPGFSVLMEWIKKIEDIVIVFFTSLFDAIRPKNIIMQFLDWITSGATYKYDFSMAKTPEEKELYSPVLNILRKIFLILDSFITTIGNTFGAILNAIIFLFDLTLEGIFRILKNLCSALNGLLTKTLALIGVETDFLASLDRYVERMNDTKGSSDLLVAQNTLLPKVEESKQNSLALVEIVLKKAAEGFSSLFSKSDEVEKTIEQIAPIVNPPNTHLADNMTTESNFNIFKTVYFGFYSIFLFTLGGYQYVLLSNYGKESFSTKTYSLGITGLTTQIKGVKNPKISNAQVYIRGETFYQRFMSTYCEHSGILSLIYSNGEYDIFSIIDKETISENCGIDSRYIKHNICKTENSYVNDIENSFRNIGAISPRFQKEESDALKLFYGYFPKFVRKSIDMKVKDLEAILNEAKKDVKSSKRIEKTLFFRIKSIFRSLRNDLKNNINEEYTNALHDLSEYYRKYYHRFMILSFYFFGNIHRVYQGAISSSIIDIYNQLVPINLGVFPLDYIHTIIQVRTAICNRELPFLTEAQSANVYYEKILCMLEDCDPYSESNIADKKPGYFLEKVSQMKMEDLALLDNNEQAQPLKMKRPLHNEGFTISDGIFNFRTMLQTENYTENPLTDVVITENFTSLLSIKNVKENVVVVISLNSIPLKIASMRITQVNECKIDITYKMQDIQNVIKMHKKIGQTNVFFDKITQSITNCPQYIVILSVFSNHTSIVYHHIYYQIN